MRRRKRRGEPNQHELGLQVEGIRDHNPSTSQRMPLMALVLIQEFQEGCFYQQLVR